MQDCDLCLPSLAKIETQHYARTCSASGRRTETQDYARTCSAVGRRCVADNGCADRSTVVSTGGSESSHISGVGRCVVGNKCAGSSTATGLEFDEKSHFFFSCGVDVCLVLNLRLIEVLFLMEQTHFSVGQRHL
jgi:hypothetical protein